MYCVATQLGIELERIGCGQCGVVQVGQWPATGLHGAGVVITHRLELPQCANAFQVAHVRVRLVHAVNIWVHAGEGESGQGRLSEEDVDYF